ncbi:MAG TPA: YhjD/YihY/BrkB family envelope integrity protein, partial [Actinomycetota bacterium]|nr:YhjD/YihY/BrkB family envelope integrity protein [Actinomycetota bacterium]
TTLGLIVLVGALPLVTGVVSAVRVAADVEVPFRALGLVATAAMEFGLFLLAYAVLTPGAIGWRTHLPGALLMTLGWELFKLAGGLLLAYYVSRATLLYGTIGAVVGLLVFLRLASGLFVFGAELSAVLRDRARLDAGTHPNG